MQNYFHAGVVDIVDGVAANIDSAAYNLLNTINTLATPQNYDEETASAEEAELVCALDTAQTVVSASSLSNVMTLTSPFDSHSCRPTCPGTTLSKVTGQVSRHTFIPPKKFYV